jgi:hypothetical protein
MKIINTSVPVRRPFDREHFVNMELLRLARDLDIGGYPCDHDAPLKQKEELLEVFDMVAIDKQMRETTIQMVIQSATTQEPNRPTDFKSFARLPTELRVRIWEISRRETRDSFPISRFLLYSMSATNPAFAFSTAHNLPSLLDHMSISLETLCISTTRTAPKDFCSGSSHVLMLA